MKGSIEGTAGTFELKYKQSEDDDFIGKRKIEAQIHQSKKDAKNKKARLDQDIRNLEDAVPLDSDYVNGEKKLLDQNIKEQEIKVKEIKVKEKEDKEGKKFRKMRKKDTDEFIKGLRNDETWNNPKYKYLHSIPEIVFECNTSYSIEVFEKNWSCIPSKSEGIFILDSFLKCKYLTAFLGFSASALTLPLSVKSHKRFALNCAAGVALCYLASKISSRFLSSYKYDSRLWTLKDVIDSCPCLQPEYQNSL